LNKKIGVALGLIFVCVAAYLLLVPKSNSRLKDNSFPSTADRRLPNQGEVTGIVDVPPPKELEETQVSSGAPNQDDIRATFEFYAESQKAANTWAAARGYDDRIITYNGISEDSLEKMANSGDMYAAQVLATSLVSRGRETATEYYELAARNGSTYALVRLADLWSEEHSLSSNTTDIKVRALSYALAAQLRGDNVSGIATSNKITANFEFSEAEKLIACKTAGELISRLTIDRVKVGMIEFDNSRSPYGDPGDGELLSSMECANQIGEI
jgi:hypothetical protein